jgi:hypothetical protein
MDNQTWILLCAVGIALLLLPGCDLQYRMLYQPSSEIPSGQSVAGSGIRFWPSAGRDYRGFIGGDQTKHARGTFVVFHGNGGTAVQRGFYADALGSLGYRVILAEYPQYGGRRGEIGEAAFVRDADETLRLAFKNFGGPLYLLGESLGGGVVAAVVRANPVPIDGILLITPWDNLRSVARVHFPYLPLGLFLKDSYENVENLAAFRGRIAIVGAGQDEIIPLRHARNLYRSLASTSVKMWVIEGGGHNDWPEMVATPWWREIAAFLGNP